MHRRDNRSHVLLVETHSQIKQVMLRVKRTKSKKAIPQSALIDCGMKGVEIGPMDLSSSTQGLPSSLHEIRQLYVLKGSTGSTIARLDAAIEQSILLTL